VTLLALGNGAPDCFSSLAGVSQERPQLVFGQLFGAAIFLTSVVAGAVCAAHPFPLMRRPFVRDVAFLSGAAAWAIYCYHRESVYAADAFGFLGLYVVYIVVVLLGRAINQRWRARRRAAELLRRQEGEEESSAAEDCGEEGDEALSIFVPVPRSNHVPDTDEGPAGPAAGPEEGGFETIENVSNEAVEGELPTLNDIPDVSTTISPRQQAWSLLWRRLCPIGPGSFSRQRLRAKLWRIIKAQAEIALRVTVPVVDEDLPMGGWCQPLVRLHSCSLKNNSMQFYF